MHRVALLGLLMASLARAQTQDVKAQVEDFAARAYELVSKGQFADAVGLYQKAYELAPTAALLFNIATVYDKKLQDRERAADYYRRYLKAEDADPQLSKRASARLDALRAEVDPTGARKVEAEAAGAPPKSASTTGLSPVLKWLVLGGGVAVAGVGGAFLGMGLGDYGTVTSAPGYGNAGAIVQMTRARALQAVADGTLKKTLGFVMLGAGAALLATSVVLFFVGGSQSKVQASLLVMPGGAAITAQGRF